MNLSSADGEAKTGALMGENIQPHIGSDMALAVSAKGA